MRGHANPRSKTIVIIFAVDDVIPHTLNALINHFYETYTTKENAKTYSTTFHERLTALRHSLKEILEATPPITTKQDHTMAIHPHDDPITLYTMTISENWLPEKQAHETYGLSPTHMKTRRSYELYTSTLWLTSTRFTRGHSDWHTQKPWQHMISRPHH